LVAYKNGEWLNVCNVNVLVVVVLCDLKAHIAWWC